MEYLFFTLMCAFISLIFSAPYIQHVMEVKQRRKLRKLLSTVGRTGLTAAQYKQCIQHKIIRRR